LPIGQITALFRAAVQSPDQKFSAFAVGQNIFRSLARPALTRGALRDRHETLARDAMDALALRDE
jgi:hypothetical protein